MKDLYPYIFKRRSTRKYEMTPLDDEVMAQIKLYAQDLKPLYDDIKVEYRFTDEVKNVIPVKAPCYFVISSEEKENYLTNVGFMFQQMDLFLSSKGLGSCWLGMANPIDKSDSELKFVMIMSFGKPLESAHRQPSGFKRKDLDDVTRGKDKRLEAARLAPSSSNTQNWFFYAKDDKIHTYQKNVSFIKARIYGDMNKVDMGIAICHLAVATMAEDRTFKFDIEEEPPYIESYTYIGTVEN